MKVFILDNGWLECNANWMVAMLVVGTKGNPHPQARWIKIPVYAVLIDHPEGNAKVMFPHDMEFFKTLKLAPQCYE
jgi:N-acyl homoserine lactone hydrolase